MKRLTPTERFAWMVEQVAAGLRLKGHTVDVAPRNGGLIIDGKELKDAGAGPGVKWVGFVFAGMLPASYCGHVYISHLNETGSDSVYVTSQDDIDQAVAKIEAGLIARKSLAVN